MAFERINLLPTDRLRAFHRGYFMRLAVVLLILLTVLIFIHGVLLIPSYFYLREQVSAREEALAAIASKLEAGSTEDAGTELAALEASIRELTKLDTAPTGSSVVSALLAVPRTGVLLSSFAFQPSNTVSTGRLVLAGSAVSRETLQNYVLELSALPFVEHADLPISAYAKETDIPFSITLTGPLLP